MGCDIYSGPSKKKKKDKVVSFQMEVHSEVFGVQ